MKFRVWNTKLKQFYKSCSIDTEGNVFTSYVERTRLGGFNQKLRLLKKEENIIQQFTGILDKDQKEIYEGDIIKSLSFDGIEIYNSNIIFDKGCFKGLLNNSTKENKTLFTLGVHHNETFEIIGNVFENPELLK